MKTIMLAAVTLLSASGMAFAGSDNYGSGYIPGSGSYPKASGNAYSLDLTSTKSIHTVDSKSTVGENSAFDMPAPGYGRGVWGR